MAVHPTIISAVGGIVYRRDTAGKLLVLLIRKRGGFWTLPKGKLDAGEALTAALSREILEETGLIGMVEQRVSTISYSIHKHGQGFTKQVTYFTVRAIGGVLCPDAAEGIIRVRWLPLAQALHLVGRPRIRRVLRAAEALLHAA